MLVYDVTKKATFDNVPRWLKEMRDHANRDIALMLVGNKTDLGTAEREVTTEEAEQMAAEFGISFVETSAKNGTNVDDAFVRVAVEVYENTFLKKAQQEKKLYDNNVVSVTETEASGGGGGRKCCK